MHLCPGKAHNDNDATLAQCNGPYPDGERPLSVNIIGLHILKEDSVMVDTLTADVKSIQIWFGYSWLIMVTAHSSNMSVR